MSEYTNQYLATEISSAPPEQLLLMLHDGAIRFLTCGVQAIENDEIDKRALYINKASAIVAEFAATLDHSQDAQLADNLDALYAYMLRQMLQANLKNDPAPLLEVRHLLSDLRATWAQAVEINKQEMRVSAASTAHGMPEASYRPLTVAM
ncbi:MAG: flagellar export chaperone FliS [Proteobacteria bacterium]|nr:flagellar export chaperone FliS [Pseudomonadota bacterium]